MAKQEFLPGQVPKKIRILHEAAAEYIDLKSQAKELAEQKKASEVRIAMLMRKHSLTAYQYQGVTIVIEEKDKVDVKVQPGAQIDSGGVDTETGEVIEG